MSKSIYQQLNTARLALTNARNDEAIQASLAQYGMGQQQLDEGLARYEQALLRHEQQKAAYGEKLAIYDAYKSSRKAADAFYRQQLAYARIALQGDRDGIRSLILGGVRQQSFAGWFDQVDHFYRNALANPALLVKLTEAGLTEEKLAVGQQRLQEAATAKARYEQKRGEALSATRVRNAAVKTLRQWMLVFTRAARVALADSPEALVKLGLGAVSERTMTAAETPSAEPSDPVSLPVPAHGTMCL